MFIYKGVFPNGKRAYECTHCGKTTYKDIDEPVPKIMNCWNCIGLNVDDLISVGGDE